MRTGLGREPGLLGSGPIPVPDELCDLSGTKWGWAGARKRPERIQEPWNEKMATDPGWPLHRRRSPQTVCMKEQRERGVSQKSNSVQQEGIQQRHHAVHTGVSRHPSQGNAASH